jgi:hypothetical protein
LKENVTVFASAHSFAKIHHRRDVPAPLRNFPKMIRSAVLFAALASSLMAGCATTDNGTTEAMDDKSYSTGSRIPARGSATVQATSDRNTIDNIMIRSSNVPATH